MNGLLFNLHSFFLSAFSHSLLVLCLILKVISSLLGSLQRWHIDVFILNFLFRVYPTSAIFPICWILRKKSRFLIPSLLLSVKKRNDWSDGLSWMPIWDMFISGWDHCVWKLSTLLVLQHSAFCFVSFSSVITILPWGPYPSPWEPNAQWATSKK